MQPIEIIIAPINISIVIGQKFTQNDHQSMAESDPALCWTVVELPAVRISMSAKIGTTESALSKV